MLWEDIEGSHALARFVFSFKVYCFFAPVEKYNKSLFMLFFVFLFHLLRWTRLPTGNVINMLILAKIDPHLLPKHGISFACNSLFYLQSLNNFGSYEEKCTTNTNLLSFSSLEFRFNRRWEYSANIIYRECFRYEWIRPEIFNRKFESS